MPQSLAATSIRGTLTDPPDSHYPLSMIHAHQRAHTAHGHTVKNWGAVTIGTIFKIREGSAPPPSDQPPRSRSYSHPTTRRTRTAVGHRCVHIPKLNARQMSPGTD